MNRVLERVETSAGDETPAPLHRCCNCGEPAPHRFCPACGQETRGSLPTAREFMREAMGRLVAFDGRLWRTVGALVFRPGFLTRAYLAGIRRRYVRPARLFLALSLMLFAVIRLEVGTPDLSRAIVRDAGEAADAGRPSIEINERGGLQIGVDEDLNVVLRGAADNIVVQALEARLERFNRLPRALKALLLLDGALRYGSYVAFLLLPLFAALQLLSYVGSGSGNTLRPRLYAEHLVYAAHLHAFGFVIVTLLLAIPYAPVRWLLLAWMLYYVVRAKQVVYGGRWPGRVLRSIGVLVVYAVALGAATVGLVLVAVLWR